MKKNKNILILGNGSIGRKHNQVLKKYFNDYTVKVIPRKFKNRKINDIKTIYNINKNLFNRSNIILICTPTIYHISHLEFFLNLNKKIFLEKPLSLNFNEINRKIKSKTFYVGYVLRHHPIISRIKKDLENKRYGKIFHIEINCLSNVLNWRKKSSKNFMSINKNLGGGVLRELSHEIDLLLYLKNDFNKLNAKVTYSKIFKKKIDTIANINIFNKSVTSTIKLNMISEFEKRDIIIYTEKMNVHADLLNNVLSASSNNKVNKIIYKSTMETLYKIQMNDFLNNFNTLNKISENIKNYIKVMKIISLSEESNKKNKTFTI